MKKTLRKSPKTVLFISEDPDRQKFYQRVLNQYYKVSSQIAPEAGTSQVDAIVYDIPNVTGEIDLKWIKSINLPLVVLTNEKRMDALNGTNRRVLQHPVRVEQVIRALWDLGVKPRLLAARR